MADSSLEAYVAARLATLQARDRRRFVAEIARENAARVRTASGCLVSFACNDYLGLSRHPEVTAAAMAATLRHGAGSGASRLISGNHPEYARLEARLAEFKGTEDAVVFGSGYLANLGIITALTGGRDLVLLDEYSHSCLRSGAKLSGAAILEFRHNDASHCAELLVAHRAAHRHVLVATEGVFSMDGDRAPLAELVSACATHDAWLLCDDAHGLGVLGNGRGSIAEANLADRVPLQMGTLSKALGGYGGFVCASHDVCEYLRNRAPSFIYSTGLPAGVVAAATKALEIVASDRELTAQPLVNAKRFTALTNIPVAQSAIVPLVIGESDAALAMSAALTDRGYFVPAIRPPTVPQGSARLRFAFSAMHTSTDIDALAGALNELRDSEPLIR
jgi:8-amino-7-oxononanoate synthase